MRAVVAPDTAARTAAVKAVRRRAGGRKRVDTSWHVESSSGPGWDSRGTAPVDVVVDAITFAVDLDYTDDGLVVMTGSMLFTVQGVARVPAGE